MKKSTATANKNEIFTSILLKAKTSFNLLKNKVFLKSEESLLNTQLKRDKITNLFQEMKIIRVILSRFSWVLHSKKLFSSFPMLTL